MDVSFFAVLVSADDEEEADISAVLLSSLAIMSSRFTRRGAKGIGQR